MFDMYPDISFKTQMLIENQHPVCLDVCLTDSSKKNKNRKKIEYFYMHVKNKCSNTAYQIAQQSMTISLQNSKASTAVEKMLPDGAVINKHLVKIWTFLSTCHYFTTSSGLDPILVIALMLFSEDIQNNGL